MERTAIMQRIVSPLHQIKKAKRVIWRNQTHPIKKNQAKVARSITDYKDFDPKLYLAGQTFITCAINKKQFEIWYLDLSMSRYICNNQEKFVDLWAKTYKFVTARRDIIRSEQVETIILPLENSSQLILTNIAYTPDYNSNLIFFSQFWETGISYHNYPEYILLK